MTITVRAAAAADAPAVAAIYAPVVTATATSFEEQPPTPDEIGRRMLARPRLPWLVADDDGRIAGYAYASAHRARAAYRWSADCSVYLDPAYQGRGLGRQLYERLITEVRDLGYGALFSFGSRLRPCGQRGGTKRVSSRCFVRKFAAGWLHQRKRSRTCRKRYMKCRTSLVCT